MSEVNPFAPPAIDVPVRENRQHYPGFGRLTYALLTIGLSFISGTVAIPLFILIVALPVLGLLIFLVAGVMFLGTVFWVSYQRLINVGFNGWWCLLMVIPLLNLPIGLTCLVAPEGFADHQTLDTSGKVTLGVVVGFLALSTLLSIAGA